MTRRSPTASARCSPRGRADRAQGREQRGRRLLRHVDAKSASPDWHVSDIAAKQYGVVSTAQLRECGVTRDAIRRRVEAGRLHRLHQGVYAVGFAGPSPEGRWMAAILASGQGAVLSHGSAAAHWGLLRPVLGPVDVSLPTQAGRRRRDGIRLHRRVALGPDQITRHKGIPITTPAVTVADLRGAVPPRLARRARRQAEMLGMSLGAGVESDRTRSDLERDFLRLCRRHNLPIPEVNARIGRLTVDFLWPRRRLVVETDGYRYHRGAVAFEEDRDRDLALRGLGYDVLRLTYRHVTTEADRVAALLRDRLHMRRSGGHPAEIDHAEEEEGALGRIARHRAP